MQPNRAEPGAPFSGAGALVAQARDIILEARAAYPERLALVSSFGADAACLLHLVAEVDAGLPVLFVDTGRHFRETLAYVVDLTARLGLRDVRHIAPMPEELLTRDPEKLRASYDPDGCCDLRKVVPLQRALGDFEAWLSGRKRFQASTRGDIPTLEHDDAGRAKYNPLAAWMPPDIEAYRRAHELPPHPLVAQGYLSIGCAPCTDVVRPGEDPRAGRWRGTAKTECGIHVPHATGLAEPMPSVAEPVR